MKSAYAVLGVPGNATPEEIEEAFRKLQAFYTPEKLASVDGAVDRFNEGKTAYAILRNPQERAAHDRKLARDSRAAPAPRAPVIEVEEASPARKLLMYGLVLLVLMFATGGYLSHRNAERRAAAAAAERQAAELRAREEQEQREAAEREEQRKRVEAARAEAAERRLSAEARASFSEQQWRNQREEAIAASRRQDALRQEALRIAEDRRRQQDAQRQVEADKRRIRELCWQNYRTPNC